MSFLTGETIRLLLVSGGLPTAAGRQLAPAIHQSVDCCQWYPRCQTSRAALMLRVSFPARPLLSYSDRCAIRAQRRKKQKKIAVW